MTTSAPGFGALLRARRLGAGLTQLELAERAHLSPRAITALECGARNAPYRHTVAALATALAVTPAQAAELAEAARAGRTRPHAAERARALAPGNLPVASTSFFGREGPLREAEAALGAGRVVAFVGRGGIGKTRTALVLAERLRARYADGAWIVDLSSATDERAIVAKLAAALDAGAGAEDAAALARALAGRNLLVVLDNCEAAVGPCGDVIEAIATGCPSVGLVATSTAVLARGRAVLFPLEPLALPAASHVSTMAELGSFDAIRLFVDRCEQYGCRLDGRDEIASLVLSICRRLEGIPLAIELAASRARSLGLGELAETISRWFSVARGGFVDGPSRHASLFATIDWSHELLAEDERVLFRRLSVFAGGFDLRAAEAVCAAPPLDLRSIRDGLASLADKSLVAVGTVAGEVRFSLFDSLRAYAARELADRSEGDAARARHAAYFARFVDDGLRRFYLPTGGAWIESIRADFSNVEAALDRYLDDPACGDAAGAMIASLRPYWMHAGGIAHAHRLADALVARNDPAMSTAVLAGLHLIRASNARGALCVDAAERAVALYDCVDDVLGGIVARGVLAQSLVTVRRAAEALEPLETAASRGRSLAERYPKLQIALHQRRGRVLFALGRANEARVAYHAAIAVAVGTADAYSERITKTALAEVEFALGDARVAAELGTAIVRECRATLERNNEFIALQNVAAYRLALGETDAAERSIVEALAILENGSSDTMWLLQHVATLLALRGDAIAAATLGGYVDRTLDVLGQPRELTEQRTRDLLAASLRAQLSADRIDRLARDGAGLRESEAIALARREIGAGVARTTRAGVA